MRGRAMSVFTLNLVGALSGISSVLQILAQLANLRGRLEVFQVLEILVG